MNVPGDSSMNLDTARLRGMVVDTFAEAFPMTATRVIVTAVTRPWAWIAGQTMTGYATSVIGCDAEAAIERQLAASETPDARPGVSLLVFAFSRDALEKAVSNRVGQCVMTCPTTACYNGLPLGEKTINVGGRLRYFGDGWQISKWIGGRRVLARPDDGRRVPLRGDLRDDQRRRGGQYHPAGVRACRDATGDRTRRHRDAPVSRRHPPLSRRNCSFGFEGR